MNLRECVIKDIIIHIRVVRAHGETLVDTVRTDLREELGFLAVFDRAMAGVRVIVDMQDRRAALLIRLLLQNGGKLSNSKRSQFDELTEAEIAAMEQTVQRAMTEAPDMRN